MTHSLDKRVMKTRQKLYNAYLRLLEVKSSSDMTIQELTTLAEVNRVTFYKHFKHIANFHEQFIYHYIMTIYAFMKPLNYKPYTKGFEYNSLVQLFTHIQQEQATYKVLFLSPHIQDFNQQLISFFQEKIKRHTAEMARFEFPGTGVDQEIVSWYGMAALIGTIHMWIQSDFPYTPEALAKSFVQLSPHSK